MLKIIRQSSSRKPFYILLLLVVVGCGPQQPTEDTSVQTGVEIGVETERPDEKGDDTAIAGNNSTATSDKASEDSQSEAPPAEKDIPKPIFPALAPGDYCYFAETDTETLHARLSIDAADRVTGNLQGTIHNEANSYYTSYSKAIDGTIDGSNLNLDVTTWIEYDKQNEQQTWQVSDRALTVSGEELPTESCDTVNKAFQNDDGLEGKDLTSSANQVHTQQVFFDPGSTSTRVSNAVVRGDRDRYQLSAQGGQKMTLSISATEDNAVFDVVAPTGLILATELTEGDIHLPNTGNYDIIVGGTRGNATYELSIEIE